MSFHQKLLNIPKSEDCLPGRSTPTSISGVHTFNGNNMTPPFSEEIVLQPLLRIYFSQQELVQLLALPIHNNLASQF